METINTIATLISMVGFPIAAYLLIFLTLRKDIQTLTTSINNLIISMTKLEEEVHHEVKP